MPAVSKKQRKLFGMAAAAKEGAKGMSPEVKKIAKSMSKSQINDFAKTKEKGLPMKKKKSGGR